MLKLLILLSLITFSSTVYSASTRKQINNSIPSFARTKLIEYLAKGRNIDAMVSTKEGHWLIVGDSARTFSNARFFNTMTGGGSMPLRKKINDFIAAGWGIDSVGITPDNNWVITAGKRRYYSSASKFDGMGIRRSIEHQLSLGRKITQITIGRNDQWSFIADSRVFHSPNAPRSLIKAIVDSKQQNLAARVVKFKPNSSEWVFIAGQRVYSSKGLKTGVKSWAEKYRGFKWQTDKVFLTANGGWSVISNQTIPKASSFIEMLESNIKSNKSMFERMKLHKTASVSLLLIDNGRITAKRAYGFKNMKTKEMAFVDTVYPVASMSKAVGSLAISEAAFRNHISLTTPIGNYIDSNRTKYLGHWGRGRSIQTAKAKKLNRVTLLRLLSHSAGFNKPGIGLEKPPISNLGDVLSGRHGGVHVKFLADAGIIYDYSGGGYAIAESILDLEAPGNSTGYMNSVLAQMDMRDSTFGSMKSNISRLARLHNTKGEVFSYRECPVKTAGGLFTTTTDYSKFLHVLMNEGQSVRSQEVLDEDSVRRMMTPMHKFGSSLRACTLDIDCSVTGETCAGNRCMVALRTGSRPASGYVGLGLRLGAPFDAVTGLPRVIAHGGTQLSTKTEFRLNLETRQGIIVFVSGPSKWKKNSQDNNESFKGANYLASEIISKYISLTSW